jgi:hypothetical protein
VVSEDKPTLGPPDVEFGPGYPPSGPTPMEPEMRSEVDAPGPPELPEQMEREIAGGFDEDGFPKDAEARRLLTVVRVDARWAYLQSRLSELDDDELHELQELAKRRQGLLRFGDVPEEP